MNRFKFSEGKGVDRSKAINGLVKGACWIKNTTSVNARIFPREIYLVEKKDDHWRFSQYSQMNSFAGTINEDRLMRDFHYRYE